MKMTKEQFIEKYAQRNTAIHCNTKEKNERFLQLCKSFNIGIGDITTSSWNSYGSNMCYDIEGGEVYYAPINYYPEENYTIIPFEIEFTLSDLETGYKLTLRNGEILFYVKDFMRAFDECGHFIFIRDYDENFKRSNISNSSLDIIKVEDQDGSILYQEKRQRAKKDANYLFVDSDGIITEEEDLYIQCDDRRFEIGNYFLHHERELAEQYQKEQLELLEKYKNR